MSEHLTRRGFLAASAATAAAGTLAGNHPARAAGTQAAPDSGKQPAVKLKKAVKIGMVREGKTLTDKFKLLKELGYDGVELNSPGNLTKDEVRQAVEASGLPVHGVVDSVHWRQTLSDPDAKVREAGLRGLKTALQDAKDFGATSVLLVPAVVNKEVAYKDAYERSQAEIRKALPLAEKLQIKILLENVWNNFLLSPVETARYIDEFESDWVGAYFDVGNVVRYGWPEHWIAALGKRLGKLDVKEYSRKLQNSKGPRAGFGVKIGDGDCDWPAVMKALAKIGYNGWATAEVGGGNRDRLKEIADRMDRAFAT